MIAKALQQTLEELGLSADEVTVWTMPAGLSQTGSLAIARDPEKVKVLADDSGLSSAVVSVEEDDGMVTLIPEGRIDRVTISRH